MITDIFLLISIFGLLGIGLVKLVNLGNGGKLYSAAGALLGGGLGIILWSLMFFMFTATIVDRNVSTITGAPSGTITVTEVGNQYVSLLPFMNFANILVLAVIFLSVIEVFASLGNTSMGMKPGPRAEKYGH